MRLWQDPQFVFGVATSAFQIEGAVDIDGKVESIWDTFCRRDGAIADAGDGRVACEHYRRWEQDFDLIASLGVDAYRFSIAWPRIISDVDGRVNQQGLMFYRQLLEGLAERGVKAYVTLYHWDLPQFLQDQGGWLNRDTALAFRHYAQVAASELGDLVQSWCTLNEPWCSAVLGHWFGVHAPGIQDRAAALQAAHHLLLAHGMALDALRKNAPQAQHGIVLNLSPYYSAAETPGDQAAAEFAALENNHWYLQALLQGRYPQKVWDYYDRFRPAICPGDMEIISQPLDYLGINYYSCQRVLACEPTDVDWPPYKVQEPASNVPVTAMGWEICPSGLTDLLQQLHREYRLPPLLITENGMASDDQLFDGAVVDDQRLTYLQQHLSALERAMESGVNVRGYFAWSLMDNFEWAEGYRKRFGLVYVDYDSQERTLKRSGQWLQQRLLERKQRGVV